ATQMAGYRDRPIDVRGHVNYQRRKLSVTDPYFKLSEARAKLVADYLIEHGHSPALIRAIGMGNWQPAVPDPRTVPEKESNMRVEIIIYQ
ncbi:MAG TPA: OmpA family protein, partial [Flavihumibacter sp.]|nr:OmpA family protein [Flavihumibacter sp.]